MNEHTTATNFICHPIRRIFGSRKQRLLHSRQAELESAYKTIRMAENYGDSYEAIADRIRTESARYKAFKQNPQPIGRITINIKRLDSNEFFQHQYEIRQPLEHKDNERKASLSYTHERSRNTVLEFVLHDQNYLPLFAIARTYSDWIGYKEFELGKDDRIFYLEMVKDKKPGYVAVHAGFKTRQAR